MKRKTALRGLLILGILLLTLLGATGTVLAGDCTGGAEHTWPVPDEEIEGAPDWKNYVEFEWVRDTTNAGLITGCKVTFTCSECSAKKSCTTTNVSYQALPNQQETCTENGNGYCTADFTDTEAEDWGLYDEDLKACGYSSFGWGTLLEPTTYSVVPARHDWGDPVYTLATDKRSATVTRSCKRTGCRETESVTIADTETEYFTKRDSANRAATCTQTGITMEYYVSFDKKADWAEGHSFYDETLALGHDYSKATTYYSWVLDPMNVDPPTCTASRMCGRQGCGHQENVSGTLTPVTVTPAACETNRVYTYRATFPETASGWTTTQTCSQNLVEQGTALGHDWGSPTYVWSEDHSTCTAKHKCQRDGCSAEETAIARKLPGSGEGTVTETAGTSAGSSRFEAVFPENAPWAKTQSVTVGGASEEQENPFIIRPAYPDTTAATTAAAASSASSAQAEAETVTAPKTGEGGMAAWALAMLALCVGLMARKRARG